MPPQFLGSHTKFISAHCRHQDTYWPVIISPKISSWTKHMLWSLQDLTPLGGGRAPLDGAYRWRKSCREKTPSRAVTL
jgi:hypothetical protein